MERLSASDKKIFNAMTISFIIPVYKVAPYISTCVKSILAQTCKDYEVLLVDDDSPDECPVICDGWARKDTRIKVLHKQNGGLSDARNYGLLHASGEYVIFVDGDDFWMHSTDLEDLVKEVKKQPDCDFVGFNSYYYYPDTNSYKPWAPYSCRLTEGVNGNDAMVALVKSGTFPMSACMKIMKRQFLLENGLFFKKGQIAEDIPWFINLLEKCKKCCFVNNYVYAYRQNVMGSITNTSGRKSFDSLLDIVETEIDKIDGRSFSLLAKDALYSFLAYEYSILLTYDVSDESCKKKLDSLCWLLEYDMNPKVRKVKMLKHLLGLHVTAGILSLYIKFRKR